jgi:hypothetical protein
MQTLLTDSGTFSRRLKMNIGEAENILRELADYLAHDRTGMIVSRICQNKSLSLKGFSDESIVSMMEFAALLRDLKTQL